MTQPLLLYLRDLLRYDRNDGVLRVFDPRAAAFVELRDAASATRMLAAGAHTGAAADLLAGYGMALAARAWQGRTVEAQLGAIIQASEQLRSVRSAAALARMADTALQRADAAIMAGDDAAQAVADVVDAALRQADRAAERCGKRAAELLDSGDRVLLLCSAGAPLWMLHAAYEQGKQLQVIVPAMAASQFITQQAALLDIATETLDAGAWGKPNLCIAAAEQIARAGSVVAVAGAQQHAAQARQHGVPFYVLSAAGPEDEAGTGAALPPELVSAIITDRGIYRPAMITRYFDDGDVPLDVIPLL